MGFTRVRTNKAGKERYTALYRDQRGKVRSAGTFSGYDQAEKAWQRAEAKQELGRTADPRKGRQRFRVYVEDVWFPNHVIELRTRENYDYEITRYIMPWFGGMRMIDILPIDVREWVTHLSNECVNPPTIRYCMTVLSAIFTTALNDQVIVLHPCKGVKTPPVPKKKRTILTPEQYEVFHETLPNSRMQLLVDVDIETGLRWGEVTELRAKDFDLATRTITVSRVVIELAPKHRPQDGRFHVKHYPKDKEHRSVRVSAQTAKRIAAHIEAESLGDEDLLFSLRPEERARPRRLRVLTDPESLGFIEPENRYRHGTLSGYSAAKCRCQSCKDVYADYRARRRAAGKDSPRRPRTVNTDGHIPRSWFRDHVWKPTLKAAKLRLHARPNDLRHAHASWLLAGGADLQKVKERLGHASITTTEKYLHTLPDEDDETLDAFDKIRNRSRNTEVSRATG
ncbi:tyrosine-type recombinase/integrase family protein [Actinomadura barringtoniae]|uniref:Tyrosine-type recombinase/integrase family protein n=1 Tax=Actinomadura barringtoniae TaxID=1427535 RepID=A0A939P7C8_9ACTN|nr:site-specific integrase [Actinomadura barringtoniae]MBO2447087.1 tyrosine-type recombinase/integrase family protein [Actinomadura barringtoniae]